MERADAEALFIANLATIDRILECLCRRHSIRGDAADDFTSWAKARLIENDYAALRAYRGEASLSTYLTVVLAMHLREYRVHEWGRWRPSAAARRAGPLGVRLETLIHRDGWTPREATRSVQVSGVANLPERQLASLAATLARRPPVRPTAVTIDQVVEVSARQTPEDVLTAEADGLEREHAHRVVATAVEQLGAEDRLLVRLRYWEEMSVADIARALGIEQRPLYRRLESLLRNLRSCLEREGVSREVAESIVSVDAD